MSEKRKDSHKKPGIRTQRIGSAPSEAPAPALDSAATAALALAVTSARKSVEVTAAPAVETAKEPEAAASAPARSAVDWRRHGALAATLALALGLGWLGGSQALSGAGGGREPAAPAWAEAAATGIRQSREDVVRLSGDVRALKVSVEAVRDGLDRQKREGAAKPVIERLDRLERTAQDASALTARLGAQLDRLDLAKLAALGERLDRIERHLAATAGAAAATTAAVAKPAPMADPVQTGSIAAKADAKHAPLEGWALREVYDGVALVESRDNRLHEVSPGQTLPGVGRVEAIERHGKAWVVLTDKGIIGTQRW